MCNDSRFGYLQAGRDSCRPDRFIVERFRVAHELASSVGTLRRIARGEKLMTEGEPALWFGEVIEGTARATRFTPSGPLVLGQISPGCVVGEIAVVTGSPRTATVVALTDMLIVVRPATEFDAFLQDHNFVESVAENFGGRLAALATPVLVTLKDGRTVVLRPGLSTDRTALDAGLAAMSKESLRLRFFSGGPPSEKVRNSLVDIDYFDHFAWVISEGTDIAGELVGSASYFRSEQNPQQADISFGIIDRAQNKGIGRVLVEALAVACEVAGITTLNADILRENTPMRSLLRRTSTRWESSEPGVLRGTMKASEFGHSLSTIERKEITAVASSVIWHTASLLVGQQRKSSG
jgi:protein lysine acetyltransferase